MPEMTVAVVLSMTRPLRLSADCAGCACRWAANTGRKSQEGVGSLLPAASPLDSDSATLGADSTQPATVTELSSSNSFSQASASCEVDLGGRLLGLDGTGSPTLLKHSQVQTKQEEGVAQESNAMLEAVDSRQK